MRTMLRCRSGFVLFWVLFWWGTHRVNSESPCPSRCRCHPIVAEGGRALGYKTDCRGLRLRSFPTGVSTNTTELDLGQNYLTSISSTELGRLLHLEILRLDSNYIQLLTLGTQVNLKELYLHNNYIYTLESKMLHGLSSLEVLHLYNAGLNTVETGSFDKLTSIKTIDLSYNRLVTLPQQLFRNLQTLQSLTITNNDLVSIGNEVFCGLPSLTYLNLRYNHLRSLQEQAVCVLPLLKTFILLNNPIACDCGVKWLYEYLANSRVSGPVCASPQVLSGRKLLDLTLQMFCDFPKANVSMNSTSTVLLRGASILLTCNATGHPKPIISWTKDGNRLEANGVDIVQSGNSLLVMSLQLRDTGTYHCISSSPAGATTDSITITVIDTEHESLLYSLTHSSGTNIRIPCSAFSTINGVPVSWSFSSLPINITGSGRVLILDNGDLYITNSLMTDSGEYVCQVGDIEIKRYLNVREPSRIVEFPILSTECESDETAPLVLDSSSPARLTCSASGNPLPLVQWFHNSVPLEAGQGLQEAFTVTVVHELVSTLLSDEGRYTCLAQNSLGEEIQEVTVEVRVLVASSNDTSAAIPVEGVMGSVLSLDCASTSDSSTPTWERVGGGSLPSSSVTAVDGSLFIGSVLLSDSGVYQCSSTIATDGSSVQYNVTVLAYPEIAVSCAPPVMRVSENSTLPVICNATGSPELNVVWFFNGKDIASVLDTGAYQIQDGSVVLWLINTSHQHEGTYSCTAGNSLGNTTQYYVVEVMRSPTFLSFPSNVVVNKGETAVFSCSGVGNPTPDVVWWMFQNDVPVKVENTGRVIVGAEYLVIASAAGTDSGRYFCALNSSVGIVISDHVFLNVWTPPILAEDLPTEYTTMEGVAVFLLCFAYADPIPAVRWFKNGTRLPIPGQHTQNRFGLSIPSPSLKDSGKYVCRVINVAGMVDLVVFLTVLTYPSVSVTPSSTTSFTSCMVLLACLDNGVPPRNFTWSLGDATLTNTSRMTVRRNGELLLTSLTLGDTGSYVCTVFTELGTDRASATLLVVEPFADASGEAPVTELPQPPTIETLTPRVLNVNPATAFQLVCISQGVPPPSITWAINGTTVITDRSVNVTIQDGLLLVSSASSYNGGTYRCKATNSFGSAEETFIVRINIAPVLVTPLLPVTATTGETVWIDCVVMGRPSPLVNWLSADGSVLPSSDSRVRVLGNNTLVINNSSVSDTGLYTCVGSSAAGVSRSTVLVTIKDPNPLLAPPVIVVPPLNQEVIVGEPLSLSCVASGQPSPNISWLINQVEAAASMRLLVNASSLTIHSAVVNDSGIYECMAVNSAGSASHSVHIEVLESTEAPVLTVFPQLLIAKHSSDNVTISCQASGRPSPVVEWFRDELNVVELGEPRYSVMVDGSLVILNSTIQDSGTYVCYATNEAGVVSVYIELQISPDTSPVFLNTPQDQFTLTRSSVNFMCSAESDPTPLIFWTHEGNPITRDDWTDKNGSLVIKNVNVKHGGIYTCHATNGQRTITTDAQLVVEERKEPPYFIIKPMDTELLKGEQLLLHCNTAGPDTVTQTWLINGYPVSDENVGVVVMENAHILLIPAVDGRDSGNYTCLSGNKYGYSEWTAYVQVYSYTSNNSLTYLEGSTAQFVCKNGGSSSNLQWSKGGVLIENSASSVNVFVLVNDLWIFSMTVKDTGEYSCAVEGSATPLEVYHLIVQVPPYIDKDAATSLAFENGTNAMLNCTAHGVPTPVVTWHRRHQGLETTPLHVDNNYSMFANGSLVILNASAVDSGWYVCQAKNPAGQSESVYNVAVDKL